MHETVAPEEVRREKVFIPENFSVSEIQKKYSLTRAASRRAKKTGSL